MDSRYYVDCLLHNISYYVGNSKHHFLYKPLYIVPVITLSKNAKPRYYDLKILVPHNFRLIFSYETCYETLNKVNIETHIVLITMVLEVISAA